MNYSGIIDGLMAVIALLFVLGLLGLTIRGFLWAWSFLL